jgi:general secretion pathway protein C
MLIRFVTFVVWLVVGATAVAWIMPWIKPKASTPAAPALTVSVENAVLPADWSPLLSRTPAAPEVAVAPDAARFRLVGVAGPVRASSGGVALLSIDGKPPRAFKPGETIEDGRVVMEVTAHTVKIGAPGGPASLILQAPLLPPPTTGVPAGLAPPSPS